MHDIETALINASRRLQDISDSPRMDAEVMLSLALEKDRSHLRAWPEKQLKPEQSRHFDALLQQRLDGVPVAYITGLREFWSRDFEVTPDVLIPRPDTELLVELALDLIPADKPYKLIDLGTGSGIIAITLAAERPNAEVIAADINPKALAIAYRNARKHRIKNIRFCESNWLDNIPETDFHLIISNPPYIAAEDPHLSRGDIRFEPKSALIAERHGLSDIEIIAETARNHLRQNGHLLVEHGYDQQQQVYLAFKNRSFRAIKNYSDLSGLPRVTYGQWQPLQLNFPSTITPLISEPRCQ